MNHDSAVRTVVSLVPEIEKSGAADTLTNYAEQNDLPPAQLEKLAQVFNTMRQVSHIDNAEESERGATIPMLDVPELVVGYATGMDQEKAARDPLSLPSHDPARVDLMTAMKREMAEPICKAASEDGPSDTPKLVVSSDDVERAMVDLQVDLRDQMGKLASEIFSAAPRISEGTVIDISEFAKEARYLQPVGMVKEACHFICEFAGPHRKATHWGDLEEPLVKRALDIDHTLGQKMAKLAELTGTMRSLEKMSADDLKDIPDLDVEIDEPTFQGNVEGAPLEIPPGEKAPDLESETEEVGKKTSVDPPKKEDDEKSDSDKEEGGGGGKSDSRGQPAKKERKGGDGGALAAKLKAPVDAVTGAVQGGAQKADEMLGKIVTKDRDNKPQRVTDQSVEDIRRTINLRRMIGTDPVLREADPREVLEVYNSITQINPELKNNMPALRLLLREATSYEGLTLDSQKTLADVRKSTSQAEQTEGENDKKRYAVGGMRPTPS